MMEKFLLIEVSGTIAFPLDYAGILQRLRFGTLDEKGQFVEVATPLTVKLVDIASTVTLVDSTGASTTINGGLPF